MTKQERLADFQARVSFSEDSAYQHKSHLWRYVPVHPFADELEHLARLEVESRSCIAVDAYWEIDGDVVFCEVVCAESSERRVGDYIRTREDGGNIVLASIQSSSISRAEFEAAMTRFYQSGQLDGDFPVTLTNLNS